MIMGRHIGLEYADLQAILFIKGTARYLQLIWADNLDVCRFYGLCLQNVASKYVKSGTDMGFVNLNLYLIH